jgi:hypothetical protein
MRRSPRNVKIAFSHAGLTHYGGILFLSEFGRMLQLRQTDGLKLQVDVVGLDITALIDARQVVGEGN